MQKHSQEDGTEWHPYNSVGGTKALFWHLQYQQLQADAFGFLLNKGWRVKIDTGIYWKLKSVEVLQI